MKEERIVLKTEHHQSEGVLLIPAKEKREGVILAHGAGSDMNSEFISFFHEKIAEAGYRCMKFNFPYSQNKKKVPDPQPVLQSIYRKAIEAISFDRVIIGGKSMGGRISSYVADAGPVKGLLFLGYPLHPPGKPDQLRDQHLYTIRKPMLFLSGTRDPFARAELLNNTLKKIGAYATLYSVEGGGHSLEVPRKSGRSKEEILNDALHAILNWLRKL
ncbi:MAG TPA: alpha/beta family hydrolase [Anaerolineales bacterium]|nr:alpha/beta family hydrolase [Anaerolineales bacterium]